MDLALWWRERRWKALLELIDQLPSANRLNEAIQNDPEQAELIAKQLAQQETGSARWSPRLAEFDLHAAMLREVIHALLGVQAAVVAAAGGKPGKMPVFPGPETEVDRAMERATKEWADNLIRIVTPHASL